MSVLHPAVGWASTVPWLLLLAPPSSRLYEKAGCGREGGEGGRRRGGLGGQDTGRFRCRRCLNRTDPPRPE